MSFPVVATSFGVYQSSSQAAEKKGESFGVSQRGNQTTEKKDGYIYYEVEADCTIRMRHDIDLTMDPKKLKRIISNRVSAQKSRWKKLQYVDALEKRCMELQMQRSVLRSQLEIATARNRYLEIEQRQLKEHISAQLQHCIKSEGIIEMYKAEITMMKMMMNMMIAPPTNLN